MNYELLFRLLAMMFIAASAYFLWTGNREGAFVTGALGACSYFLSLRVQIKRRLRQREEDEKAAAESES